MSLPPLVASLDLKLKGVRPIARLMGNIILGLELEHHKEILGYCGEGSWQSYREETKSGQRPLWGAYCKAQGGVTEDSVRNFMECAEALKRRCRWCEGNRNGAKTVLKMLSKPPSQLSERQRRDLIERMCSLFSGSTQVLLRKEYQIGETTPEEIELTRGLSKKQADAQLDVRKRLRVARFLASQCGDPDGIIQKIDKVTAMRARLALRAFLQQKTGTSHL